MHTANYLPSRQPNDAGDYLPSISSTRSPPSLHVFPLPSETPRTLDGSRQTPSLFLSPQFFPSTEKTQPNKITKRYRFHKAGQSKPSRPLSLFLSLSLTLKAPPSHKNFNSQIADSHTALSGQIPQPYKSLSTVHSPNPSFVPNPISDSVSVFSGGGSDLGRWCFRSMEEEDEMHSPVSVGSGSPASPRSNGRITVTVAVPSQIQPDSPPQNNALTLVLPSSQVRSSGGREDCWSESATAVLIEAWGERYLELSRGNLKQKHWKEVADIVCSREDYGKTPKTDIQCKNRIDTVKKKYKLEKSKMVAGGGPSKWSFFDKLDHLIGATAKVTTGSVLPGFLAKSHKIPMGMPVGVRGGGQFVPKHLQKANAKKRGQVEWDSDSSREMSPVSADSFPPPPPTYELKRPRTAGRGANTGFGRGGGRGGVGKEIRGRDGGGEKKGVWGNSMRELTQAMLRFGEAYEHAETAKLQQVVEMEKQRMKFAKELELQRMQFFMNTQLEISQLKHGRRNGNASNHHHHRSNNNSDSN